MRCPAPMDLDRFAHGELDAKRSLTVHLHLSACASCAAEVSSLCAERRALTARGRARTAPPNLLARVERSLREASREVARPGSRWSFAPLLMTAMAAVMFFALLPAPAVEDAPGALTASAGMSSGANESQDPDWFTRVPQGDPEISRTEAAFSACLTVTPCTGGRRVDGCR